MSVSYRKVFVRTLPVVPSACDCAAPASEHGVLNFLRQVEKKTRKVKLEIINLRAQTNIKTQKKKSFLQRL